MSILPSTPEPTGPPAETDPRFPSGNWLGFFLQKERPGRHSMELQLSFSAGTIKGEGRDYIGEFRITGRYTLEDGRCHWTKRYTGKHDVFYQGYNEGKGIWGLWEIPPHWRGGFHIWPEKYGSSGDLTLSEAIDEPISYEEDSPIVVDDLVPAGAED